MNMILILAALILNCISQCKSQKLADTRYYTVVASKVLRPNSDFHVSVSVHNITATTYVLAEISGHQQSGGLFKVSQYLSIDPSPITATTRVVRFQISDIGSGSYNLTIQGSGGLNFNVTAMLEYLRKSYSVFIQTDKAIYKPEDKVGFRVIVLSSALRPVTTRFLDVRIMDGRKNLVKEWKKQLTSQGVFSSELLLSSYPVLGDWNITVNILDQVFSKGFSVAEYVLPKFLVTVDAPKYSTFKESKFPVAIHAMYVYGKPVQGEATVSVNPNTFSGVIQPFLTNPIFKVVPINGKAVVEFDLVKDLRLSNDYERMVQIDVTVEEAFTGRRQNNSAHMLLHRHKYKMEFVKTAEYFRPGLKYTGYIKISHHDGTPVTDETNFVKVRQYYTFNDNDFTENKYKLSNDGKIQLVYEPPLVNATTLRIEAEYLDLKESLPQIGAAISPSNTFIQAVLKTEQPVVNEEIEIEVSYTGGKTDWISYEVMGRGDVVIAQTMPVAAAQSTTAVRFVASSSMAPLAHFIVHFTRNDGEVVADALDIEIKNMLLNYVQASFDKSSTEPGATVELNVEAKPYSFIGLLAVDQSVLLLKSGNDITQKSVIQEMESYDHSSRRHLDLPFVRDLDDEASINWWPSSSSYTAHEAFDKSGAIILTNGYVHEHAPLDVEYFWCGKSSNVIYLTNSSTFLIRKHGELMDHVMTLKPDIGPPVVYIPVTRRPLAGPFAFSNIPIPVWNHPRVFLQHAVFDTWLFGNLSVGYTARETAMGSLPYIGNEKYVSQTDSFVSKAIRLNGKGSLKTTVPDTITSYILTAFSIDNTYGLGLINAPVKLGAFKQFFISIDLPYSIIRGETVAIPTVIFNYMNRDVSVDVTLENVGEFEFADYSNDVDEPVKLELYRRKKLTVRSNGSNSVTFLIKAIKLGFIGIKVTANSAVAGDAIEKKLLVKPEGETVYKSKSIFVDLRKLSSYEGSFHLDIPENVISGSEHVELAAIGDVLSSNMLNTERLIKMPFGCGEQNMLNFVPIIVVMEYLKSTNQLTQSLDTKAVNYLESGYQQELTYRWNDGSFSAFGQADTSGSTWLTAFVVKSFRQASSYISVEESVLTEALNWLAKQQAANGSFPEVGKVSHTEIQGGSSHGLALTAYTLIAFLENLKTTTDYRNVVAKAVEYIVRNIESASDSDDVYALAICTYALHLAYHPAKDIAFTILESKAKVDGDLKFWKRKERDDDVRNPWTKVANSVNVEMTSYALLSYVQRALFEDALPILSWLITQQNHNGGFASTQDTVIGLYALSKLAEYLSSSSELSTNINLEASAVAKGINETMLPRQLHRISINKNNANLYQKYQLHRKTREINVTANGSGFAVLKINYEYNVNVTGEWPLFVLDPQVDKSSNADYLQLSICSSFINEGKIGNETKIRKNVSKVASSNMAIMEITLPSGYTADVDSLPGIQLSHYDVKRIETKNSDTVVVLYFDSLSSKEVCPTVSAFRTHKVANQKPTSVLLYDYYDQTRKARVFYEPNQSNVCDICEDTDCSKLCKSSLGGKPKYQKNTNSATNYINNLSNIFVFINLISLLVNWFPYFY